jgi:hypothetical protein
MNWKTDYTPWYFAGFGALITGGMGLIAAGVLQNSLILFTGWGLLIAGGLALMQSGRLSEREEWVRKAQMEESSAKFDRHKEYVKELERKVAEKG